MIRSKKRIWICTILLLANLALIWGNSMLPATQSDKVSGSLLKALVDLLQISESLRGILHLLLRKAAHFTEFACLGLLLTWLRGMNRKKLAAIFPVLGGLTVALVDETIQGFVPGRTPMVTDVLIDTAGAFFGMLVLLGGYHLYKRIKSKHLNILEETT